MNRGLTVAGVLHVWEWGHRCHPVDRALLILGTVYPELPHETLAALTVGERDARLIGVRTDTFGGRGDAVVDCPSCSAVLEFSFDVNALAIDQAASREPFVNAPITAELDGMHLLLHRPDSRDLAETASAASASEACRVLFRRCVLTATRDGQDVALDDLPEDALEEISSLLGKRDEQADLVMNMRCEACGHSWAAIFDIGEFLWHEIDGSARKAAVEIATLAHAFGWSEAEILALTPARRRLYLELAV